MKKVLIICDMFPPAFGPRMGYLTKYLKSFNWEVVVVTEKTEEQTFAFLTDQCKVKAVDFYKNAKHKGLRWFFILLGELLFKFKSRKLYRVAMEELKDNSFDLILCSTYRSFPLWTARKVSKKTGLPLVVDIRDIIEQYTGYEFIKQTLPDIPGVKPLIDVFYKRSCLNERNHVLRAANHVVTISPWHVSVLKEHNKKTSLIYNGYDPELFYPAHTKSDKFIIAYTGRLLSLSMRNPGLLLKALKRLSDDKIISDSDCRVEWYVDKASKDILIEESKSHGVLNFMEFKGYVPASEIPQILNKSSILLLLTNKADEKGPKGIMTTKFFEFLAVEKPILCVRSDEDSLEKVINETNSGLAAKNENEVYEFIHQHFIEWKKTGKTHADINKEKTIAFSRKEQALQFIRIFEEVLKKQNG